MDDRTPIYDGRESEDFPAFTIPEEEFHAASSPPDLKGRINLRIEQALQEEIDNIAEDTSYPLKSASEVVRYCCLIGIARLRQWKPRPTLLGAIRSANALAIRDKIQCEALDMLQRMDERIAWYIEHREYDECVTLVGQIRSYFEGIPNDFWKRHIIEQIDKKFAQWLDTIDTVRKSQ